MNRLILQVFLFFFKKTCGVKVKQNLQIKNFLGVNENSNTSQIFIALITYFLIELIRRNISKQKHRFGHFITIIRVCLLQYKVLSYVANDIKIVVKKARDYDILNFDDKQIKINGSTEFGVGVIL